MDEPLDNVSATQPPNLLIAAFLKPSQHIQESSLRSFLVPVLIYFLLPMFCAQSELCVWFKNIPYDLKLDPSTLVINSGARSRQQQLLRQNSCLKYLKEERQMEVLLLRAWFSHPQTTLPVLPYTRRSSCSHCSQLLRNKGDESLNYGRLSGGLLLGNC